MDVYVFGRCIIPADDETLQVHLDFLIAQSQITKLPFLIHSCLFSLTNSHFTGYSGKHVKLIGLNVKMTDFTCIKIIETVRSLWYH